MADSNLSTLNEIRVKIRRLTKSPSSSQITDSQLDDYINTFILYDMPASVKLDGLKKILTFYTTANQGTYFTQALATDPLYNFKNVYVNINPLVYLAGNRINFFQDRSDFYGLYPQTNSKINIGTGDGVTTNYTGTLSNIPIMPNQVTITSTDINSLRLLATDDGDGNLTGDVAAGSTINYTSGAYNITFTTAPKNNEDIWLQAVPYKASKPSSVLFINEEFTFRPIPDISYRVDVEVYQRPTEMDSVADMPWLSEWWQFIAYGASIKILQDRSDNNGVAMLMPEFKNQETLILRRTIMQNSSQRTPTIFSGNYIYTDNYLGDE